MRYAVPYRFVAALALSIAAVRLVAVAQDVHVRVDPKGPGSIASTTDYTTIQQALDHHPFARAGYRVIIEIVPGVYRERIIVTQNHPNVTLLGLGKGPEDVVITNSLNAKSAGGTFFTETAEINGEGFEADNLTFENTAGNTGQAVAAAVRSDRAVFKHVRFLGDQDTLFADYGRQYYVDSYIRGGVDFIFGNATAVFDHSTIEEIRPGYLTAQSRTSPDQTTGYVIANSKITRSICLGGEPECRAAADFNFYLGRPWRPFSRVIVMNTELPNTLNAEGWSIWNKTDTFPPKAYYAEFHNSGAGADLGKRPSWSHQLTADQAKQYEPRSFLKGGDNWNPIAAAAALPNPPVQMSGAEDHQRLMGLLHLTALRPPVSHDPKSANPTNFDEAKANPWPNLPDPLTMADGRKVTTAKQWFTQRRPELERIFSDEIVGRVPANAPAITWRVASEERETVGTTPVITQHLIGHADNTAYPLLDVNMEVTLTRPAKASGPVPLVVELTFENYPRPRASALEKAAAPPSPADGPTWKEQVIARGWGYALIFPTTLQADNAAGLTAGIIGLANHGQPRTPEQWGTLRAWAWGASRLVDYLQTDAAIDSKRIAIEGHSRFGKAALVTMAYEPRFAVLYSSSSGAGGANLARRRFGEQMENIAAPAEYYWMAGNYLRFAAVGTTPNDMPVDMHELIAMCAPRPVFIGGGVTDGDGWADTRGTFLAEVAAGPVYRLLGKRDLGTTNFPPVGTALIDGDLGFRQHNGGHTPIPNFPTFLEFAGHYFDRRD
jgi:pectin methylesterase-like acyl-CoA thioesterase